MTKKFVSPYKRTAILSPGFSEENSLKRIRYTEQSIQFFNELKRDFINRTIVDKLHGLLHFQKMTLNTLENKSQLRSAWFREKEAFCSLIHYLTNTLNQKYKFFENNVQIPNARTVSGKDIILYLQLGLNRFYPSFDKKNGIDYAPIDPNDARTITLNSGYKERVENVSRLIGQKSDPYTGCSLSYLDRITIRAYSNPESTSVHFDLTLLEEDETNRTVITEGWSVLDTSFNRLKALICHKRVLPHEYVLNGNYIQAFYILMNKGVCNLEDILSLKDLYEIQNTLCLFVEALVKSRIRYWFILKRKNVQAFTEYNVSCQMIYDMILSGINDTDFYHTLKNQLSKKVYFERIEPYLQKIFQHDNRKSYEKNYLLSLTQTIVEIFVSELNCKTLLEIDWPSLISKNSKSMFDSVSALLNRGEIELSTALQLNRKNYDTYEITYSSFLNNRF